MSYNKYFQKFKLTIIALEDAWERGEDCLNNLLKNRTIKQLLTEKIIRSYRRLLKRNHTRPGHFRKLNFNILLVKAEKDFSKPKAIFQAQVIWHKKYESHFFLRMYYYFKFVRQRLTTPLDEPFIIGIQVQTQSETFLLRLDQVLALHFWGISYRFQNPILTLWLKRRLIQQTLDKFAVALRSLQDIENHFYKKYSKDKLTPITSFKGKGHQFEQLIYDILNEIEYTTHKAKLFEDFWEKTDFRFKAPHLGRKNGARIQVTSTTDFVSHNRKILKIKYANELIIISPRTLAEAVYKHEKGFYNDFNLEEFSKIIGPYHSIKQLSYLLRDVFFDALDNHRFDDPRGPLAAVPVPVRQLVRSFVRLEAYWSTAKLRLRENQIEQPDD